MRDDYEVAVVGGGLLGSAIAWGLGRLGQRVCVLDEGDVSKRASRANFALVWVQSKGLGLPEYTLFRIARSYLTLESVLSIAFADSAKMRKTAT